LLAKKYIRAGKFVTVEVNIGVITAEATLGVKLPGIGRLVVVGRGALVWGESPYGQVTACA